MTLSAVSNPIAFNRLVNNVINRAGVTVSVEDTRTNVQNTTYKHGKRVLLVKEVHRNTKTLTPSSFSYMVNWKIFDALMRK